MLVGQQELWTHNELVQVDCSENGEVLSITFYNDKIFSGHSDGTIKVPHQTRFIFFRHKYTESRSQHEDGVRVNISVSAYQHIV